MVQNIGIVLCRPEEYLIRQDEKANDVFVISNGDCEVYVKDWQVKENRELYVRTLYQGMYFGEIALMNNTVRSATVKSRNYSVLGRVQGNHFLDCLYKHPDIRHSLNSNIEMY